MNTSRKYLAREIDAIISKHYQPDLPGCAVVVVRGTETIFRKGFGLANMELNVPIQPESVFRLASITKQFTAVAILMLVERGKLALSDPLTKLLPSFPAHGKRITVEHLLTHTSGLKSLPVGAPEFMRQEKEDRKVAEVIDYFKDQPPDCPPSERCVYNNYGYQLLGAIIEQASGLSYKAFLKKNIFDKLGMTNTYHDRHESVIPGRVAGYTRQDSHFANARYISMTQIYAAGELASSVDDLMRWNQVLRTNQLIKRSTRDKAWSQYQLKSGAYTTCGYGWMCLDMNGERIVEHAGGCSGFAGMVKWLPERDCFLAILDNSSGSVSSIPFMAYQIASLLANKPHHEPEVQTLTAKKLSRYVGTFQFAPGFESVVTRRGSHLFYQPYPGSPQVELLPFVPHKFFMRDSIEQCHFITDERGAITAFKWCVAGQDVGEAQRV